MATLARRASELAGYCSISIGMALSCTGYAMLGELRAQAPATTLVAGIVIAGALCILLSLGIAELASMFPSAPGVRTYLKAAFGDRGSLVVTFMVLLMVVLFAGVESYYCAVVIHRLAPGLPPPLIATANLAAVVALNLGGVELPRRAHVVLIAALLALIVAVSIAGLDGAAALAPAPGGALELPAIVGGAVFVYTGFEWVTPLGRSPAAYRRLVPWSMPLALAILAAVFALLAAAVGRAPGGSAMAPHVALGQAAFPRGGVAAMAALSFFSMFSAFNAGLMGSARLVYALAREHRFPRWGATVSVRRGTPVGAILAVASLSWLSSMAVLSLPIQRAISLVCAGVYCFLYAAFVVAQLRLRRTQPDRPRPFRAPVPAAVQVLLAVAMAGLGVAVLLSEPSLRGAIVASVLAMAALSLGAAVRLTPPRAAPRAPIAVPNLTGDAQP